jgi:hypothetical protein
MAAKPQFSIGTLVQHSHFGLGRIIGFDGEFYVVQCKGDTRNVPFSYQEMKAVQQGAEDPELQRLKMVVAEVLGDYGWIETNFEMGKRWIGGTLRMIPGKEDTAPKDIPIDAFFKKIIGVREKLRVLEQKINNHDNLDAADKAELQGYITRCYGSLTTFNAMFAEKESFFVGSGAGATD